MKQNVQTKILKSGLICVFTLFIMAASISPALAIKPSSLEEVAADSKSNTEETLVRLNKEMMEQYILHHNTQPYDDAMLEDYLLVVEIGLIENREHILTTVGNLDIQSAKLTHEEFLHYGSTAVLIGTLEMEGKILGHTIDGKIRYMSVFILHNDRWRLLSGSFSPVVHPRVLYGEPEAY